jgi:hypothetical protein
MSNERRDVEKNASFMPDSNIRRFFDHPVHHCARYRTLALRFRITPLGDGLRRLTSALFELRRMISITGSASVRCSDFQPSTQLSIDEDVLRIYNSGKEE